MLLDNRIRNLVYRNNGFLDRRSITFMPTEAIDFQIFHYFKQDDIFVIFNDPVGTIACLLKMRFPRSRIIIVDPWGFFINSLTRAGWECYNNMEEIPKMNKRPVLLINSPYTDGTQSKNNQYVIHQENAINKLNPVAMASWAPDNFLLGDHGIVQHRKNCEKKFGKPVFVKWLNQNRDWNGSIRIDTVSTVWDSRAKDKTSIVKARYSDNEYEITFKDLYIPAESKEEFEYITSIQTHDKVVVKGFNPTGRKAKQVQIKVGNKFEVINGLEYDSNNKLNRQAVSYMRSESLIDVPPGPSVPSKYRELYCRYSPTADQSTSLKFGRYMRSGHTRWLVSMRYNTRSLDSPALSLVPIIDLDVLPDNFSDADLFKYFDTPTVIQEKILDMGHKSPY